MTDIKRIYGDTTVLDIDSFSLEENESIALVGPNGSGKTTLLYVAALLNPPTSGEVKIKNRKIDFRNPGRYRANVTLVTQDPFFFAGSLLKNMAFGLASSGISKIEIRSRIEKYINLLEIANLANRSPRTFSSGELKRAAIARALVHKTPILLLDEPFANVDSRSSTILEKVIKEHANEQSVIFSTHELSKAYNLADRIVTLQNGKISPWTPDNLYKLISKPVEDGFELLTDSGLGIYYPGEIDAGRVYTVSINANQVLISREKIESSAQNSFKGVIRRIEAIGNNLVGFTIECTDDFLIRATVTNRTVKEFQSTVGDDVWVHFKSAAVHVFK